MYQTLKGMQSNLYGEIKRLYQKSVFLSFFFFSILGTKTINNMEVTLYRSFLDTKKLKIINNTLN